MENLLFATFAVPLWYSGDIYNIAWPIDPLMAFNFFKFEAIWITIEYLPDQVS